MAIKQTNEGVSLDPSLAAIVEAVLRAGTEEHGKLVSCLRPVYAPSADASGDRTCPFLTAAGSGRDFLPRLAGTSRPILEQTIYRGTPR
jgi:hypothetical protein